VDELGGLDILVNAGDLRQAGPLAELTDADLDRLVSANLTGPIRLFRAAGRAMMAGGKSGRIIQVVSILAERGVPNTATYGATQAGLMALIRTLSLEWARTNIRINGIGLGWMERDPLIEGAVQRQSGCWATSRLAGWGAPTRPDRSPSTSHPIGQI